MAEYSGFICPSRRSQSDCLAGQRHHGPMKFLSMSMKPLTTDSMMTPVCFCAGPRTQLFLIRLSPGGPKASDPTGKEA